MRTTQDVVNYQIARMKSEQRRMVFKECDGVPRIVQHVTYNYPAKLFIARLFNDQYAVLDDGLVQGLGLFDRPGSEHFADLEPKIERLVLEHRLYLEG
jgi:hypothetical protein